MRERGITLDPRWSKLAASNNYTKGETAEENEDECCRSSAVPVSHSNANARIDRKSKFPIYPFENEISKRENRREGKKSEGESKEKGKVPRKTFLSFHP